jgi:hypothetical protein
VSIKPVSRRKPPQSDRRGKRPQRFTQRDVERAARAAPNRVIRITRDGAIELVPVERSAPKS